MAQPTIAIVTGGDSLEATSSLASARNVFAQMGGADCARVLLSIEGWRWSVLAADGLTSAELGEARLDPSDFQLTLPRRRVAFDAAFIALHGAPAETGHLQAYFEQVGLPYTGSGVLASATAMDKRACKRAIAADGSASVARDWTVPAGAAHRFDPSTLDCTYPCIVKPNAYGSGVGVSLAATPQALAACVRQIGELGQDALVEEYIAGREFTVGAVILKGETHILPPAEVFRPDPAGALAEAGHVGFTDRQSAQLTLTPELDDGLAQRLADTTRAVGQALGCRSLYRVDYMLGQDGTLFFLEVNTIPGMTERSVFTAQVRAAGFEEGALYRAMLEDALAEARGARNP